MVTGVGLFVKSRPKLTIWGSFKINTCITLQEDVIQHPPDFFLISHFFPLVSSDLSSPIRLFISPSYVRPRRLGNTPVSNAPRPCKMSEFCNSFNLLKAQDGGSPPR